MPEVDQMLPGRTRAMLVPDAHYVHGRPLAPPFESGLQQAVFAMGCFWGAERLYWTQSGVYTTAVGYINGVTPNPTYAEVCSGYTGHAEAVLVVFDPAAISYEYLLRIFWQNHDPTQGMRQANDIGTQYRSGVYTFDESQLGLALRSRDIYSEALAGAGFGDPTTEICPASRFYYAEAGHQQYLSKNPDGYCGITGTGVDYPDQ